MRTTELKSNLLIPKPSFTPVTTHTLPRLLTTTFFGICDRVSIDQGSRISRVKSQTALLYLQFPMLEKTEHSQASSSGDATKKKSDSMLAESSSGDIIRRKEYG